MDSTKILRTIHKVGLPISGEVIRYENIEFDRQNTIVGGQIILKTESKFKSILSIRSLFDYAEPFDGNRIPKIGEIVTAVVYNFVNGVLYLSATPNDLSKATQKLYADYYKFIEYLSENELVFGTVAKITSFGIFVKLYNSSFVGIIDDIGYEAVPQEAKKLPRDKKEWPEVGTEIRCIVVGFRFGNRQISLLWSPE